MQPSRPNPVSASAIAIGEQSIISDLSFSDQSLHHQFRHIETLLHSNENSLVKYEEYYFNRQQQQQTSTATSNSSGSGLEMEVMNGSSDGYVKEDQVMPSSTASGALMKVVGMGMPTIQERNMNNSASADSMSLVTSNSHSNEAHHHQHNGPPQSSSSSSFVSISSSFNLTSTTTNNTTTTNTTITGGGGGEGGVNSSSKSVVQKALHFASKIFSSKRSSDLHSNNNNNDRQQQQLLVESSELLLAVNPTDNHLPSQHNRQLQQQQHQLQQNHDQYDPHEHDDKRLESGRMNYLSTETIDTALSSTSNDVSSMLHTSSPSLIVGAGGSAFSVSPMPPKGSAVTPLRSHSGRTIVQQSSKT